MLTETGVRNINAKERAHKLPDSRGLYLLVQPTGSKLWRFRHTFEGREKKISLGAFPDVPLALVSDRHEEARKLVAAGVDPSASRRPEGAALADTFAAIANEGLEPRRGRRPNRLA